MANVFLGLCTRQDFVYSNSCKWKFDAEVNYVDTLLFRGLFGNVQQYVPKLTVSPDMIGRQWTRGGFEQEQVCSLTVCESE